jgi:hypothetical protein
MIVIDQKQFQFDMKDGWSNLAVERIIARWLYCLTSHPLPVQEKSLPAGHALMSDIAIGMMDIDRGNYVSAEDLWKDN